MALFKTGQFLVKRIYKNESVFNDIIKQNIPISLLVEKYKRQITKVNFKVLDLLYFPSKTFLKIDKKILKNIIDETYKIVQKKSGRNAVVYDSLMKSYMYYKIDFDINDIREDMGKNKIKFDENIYGCLIKYYSNKGEMIEVENLLGDIKKNEFNLSITSKYIIASGYIIAGQPEMAKSFSKEHSLHMTSPAMFFSRCYGYASIRDVVSLKNVLAEMEKKNVIFYPKEYFILYYKLICGGVDDSDLKEIINLTEAHLVNMEFQLCILITILNSSDYFHHSIIIIEKLIDLIQYPDKFIEKFTTSRCPVEILKYVFDLLMPLCGKISYKKSIFGDLDYGTALDVCDKFSKGPNWKLIHFSLLTKAISLKSKCSIDDVLQFSFMKLQQGQINFLILHCFIPLILDNKLVSNCGEILELFPSFRIQMLPGILMKYLCSGEFQLYNEIISKMNIVEKLVVKFDWKCVATDIRNYLTMMEIDKWTIEAGKYFDAQVIDKVLLHLVINEILKLSKTNSSSKDVEEIIGYAKKWNVEFPKSIITNLIKAIPTHSDLLDRKTSNS